MSPRDSNRGNHLSRDWQIIVVVEVEMECINSKKRDLPKDESLFVFTDPSMISYLPSHPDHDHKQAIGDLKMFHEC